MLPRRELQVMVQNARPGRWGVIPMRMLAPSPASGGAQQSDFTDQLAGPPVSSPTLLPQGPPLLEDGEPHPDAAPLEDIALGQIGTDCRGYSFQLLRGSGEKPPRKILLRSLDTGETFWCSSGATVCASTVSYRDLPEDLLSHWYPGSQEGAVWKMRESGLWDMQVQTTNRLWTQIGNWILCEAPRKPFGRRRHLARKFSSAQKAQLWIEERAHNVEAYPAIQSFEKQLLQGSLPAPGDTTDRIRNLVQRSLLGRVHPMSVASEIYEVHARQFSVDQQRSLAEIASGVLSASGMSWKEDNGFNKMASLWRKASLLRLES